MNLEQMKSRLKAYIQVAMESFPTKGEQFYSELVEVLQSKGNDYSNEDKLSNFKEVGNMTHTDPRVVCATLIGVKVSRICNLLKSGKAPDNESVKDSILDLSNYNILLHLINIEMEEENKDYDTKRFEGLNKAFGIKKEGTDFGTQVHKDFEDFFKPKEVNKDFNEAISKSIDKLFKRPELRSDKYRQYLTIEEAIEASKSVRYSNGQHSKHLGDDDFLALGWRYFNNGYIQRYGLEYKGCQAIRFGASYKIIYNEGVSYLYVHTVHQLLDAIDIIDIDIFNREGKMNKRVITEQELNYNNLGKPIDNTFKKESSNLQEFEIWMEGYAATGQSGTARLIGKGKGVNFDEAVRDYMSRTPGNGIEQRLVKEKIIWSIWACSLYNNEKDARKAFG